MASFKTRWLPISEIMYPYRSMKGANFLKDGAIHYMKRYFENKGTLSMGPAYCFIML